MPVCLYCGKDFRKEDVLFGSKEQYSMREADISAADSITPSSVALRSDDYYTPEYETVEGSDASARSNEYGRSANQAVDANGFPLGKWVDDKPYDEFITKFRYSEQPQVYTRQAFFAVKWTTDPSTPTAGHAAGGTGFPVSVELHDDAIKALNPHTPITTFTHCYCPNCHCELQPGFMDTSDADVRHIAFLGGSRAGKTQYMTAMYQNITAFLSGKYHMPFKIKFDRLSESVLKYLSACFGSSVGIPTTERNKPILPVVFSVTQQGVTPKFVALYDCPGEIFDADNRDELASSNGLKRADSLIVAADSAGQVFSSLRENVYDDEKLYTNTCMLSLTDMIDDFRTTHQRNYNVIAFIMTKFDMVMEQDACSFVHNARNGGSQKTSLKSNDSLDYNHEISIDTINTVSNELKYGIFLGDGRDDELLCGDIISHLEQTFNCDDEHLKVFGISTFRRKGDEYEFESCGHDSMQRHRLLEPLFYLLVELGLVKAKEEGFSPNTAVSKTDGEVTPRRGLFGRRN